MCADNDLCPPGSPDTECKAGTGEYVLRSQGVESYGLGPAVLALCLLPTVFYVLAYVVLRLFPKSSALSRDAGTRESSNTFDAAAATALDIDTEAFKLPDAAARISIQVRGLSVAVPADGSAGSKPRFLVSPLDLDLPAGKFIAILVDSPFGISRCRELWLALTHHVCLGSACHRVEVAVAKPLF